MEKIEATDFWFVPALLLVPGLYLLWFAIQRKEFFRYELWRRWTGRAGLVALMLELPNRYGGPRCARFTLSLIACTIIFLGTWISLSLYL
jgi:hypothetical protein